MNDPIPDTALSEHVRAELVRFVRALRHSGASVPANAATTGARSLAEIGFREQARVRTALRASLLTDSDDFETFDRLFEAFWRRLLDGLDTESPVTSNTDGPDGGLAPLDAPTSHEASTDRTTADDDTDPQADRTVGQSVAGATSESTVGNEATTTALYSPSGTASSVESSLPADTGTLASAFHDLTRTLDGLQGRRFQSGTDDADVRRALRASVSTGGTVLSVPRRERRRTAVRALLLVDVSRSVLDTVDRGFLIEFLRRAVDEWRDVRVFFFDESLRETTDAVGASSATAAMEALEAAETVWGGGTRIGESFRRLHQTAPDALDRRTIVFVISDGLEMGDVSTLERELSWLACRSKRMFWLNPLATAEAYEPTARGMAASLPYLDGLFAFEGPSDVAELARQLREWGPGRRIGYEFDSQAAESHRNQPIT
ncbi:VWA domain-containing protein [Halalkalicoccus jeotgali]|uniref:VWA containing CoxE-like protein n=1 Tax=Halalkalicoccus jeotgali (strain DSM 18796 / CECT 7217 / JCM 14584 / KCTC 4019 / B3) TaxID=795797 RepID=D8JBB1_HALJB|nr:VWA domain-containing protein [Halalkalicoccus jeotgali]ADJ16564.1 VWA containing CoxE-like protein [Halalkalicoccus jeotgali B3]ELY41340.1 VWA containing CoxE-like protein [Halalkalicoccus jeotgali B3]